MDSNVLSAVLDEVPPASSRRIDGILFSGVCFIKLIVDGAELTDKPEFAQSLVVYDQLQASALQSGRYLLFTCACGAADDGGWDKIEASHVGESIVWDLSRDGRPMRFCFKRTDYCDAIAALAHEIQNAEQRGLKLEPTHVIYPEE